MITQLCISFCRVPALSCDTLSKQLGFYISFLSWRTCLRVAKSQHLSLWSRLYGYVSAVLLMVKPHHHPLDHATHTLHLLWVVQHIYHTFDSLLSHRDLPQYYPEFPFFLVHSTEPSKHLFSVLHSLKKDFNYADILYLQPKLQILILGAFGIYLWRKALNYHRVHHTYFHAKDLNIEALKIWPSDGDL